MKKAPKSSKKQSHPSRIEMSHKELEGLIKKIEENSLDEKSRGIIINILTSYVWLNTQLERGRLSIKKLRELFFGSKSEKKDKLFENEDKDKDKKNGKKEADSGSDSSPPSGNSSNSDDSSENKSDNKDDNKEKNSPKVGHGKNSPSDYELERIIEVSHESLSVGDICPSCNNSPLYPYGQGSFLSLKGQAPIVAEHYKPEKLRCSGCGALFTATLPEEIGKTRTQPTANAMVAILNYGSGMPFYRLENLQSQLKTPLADSTQFDMAEEIANSGAAVVQCMKKMASDGWQIGHDDTKVKILDLTKESSSGRKGIQTTAVVSKVGDKVIHLFFSGRQHAGENLDDLLKERTKGLSPPIQVSDALSANFTTEFKTIVVKCLDHGRRGFVNIVNSFPKESQFVIEQLAEVYAFDAQAKELNLDNDQRLEYHQVHSAPIMNNLNSWMEEQFENREVEPNSTLGEAICYFLKHWNGLSEFLRTPGAPLSNAEVERLIKKCVLRRKNSLFYRTEMGALIGDILMSLIQTAHQAKVNVFDYLVALQINSSAAKKAPENWLPWNYQQTLATL